MGLMKEDFWKKSCVIYYILDRITGKGYVGQTRQKLRRRMKSHKSGSALYIDCAIKKYGWEKFSVFVLEECATPEELNEREKYWIEILNTLYPNGYNRSAGGGNYIGSGRPVRCIDTGEIFESASEAERALGISAKNICRVCLKQHIRAGGLKFEYVDAPLTEEEKSRERKKPHIKPVRCLEYPDMIFESVTAAGEYFGINMRLISKACSGELIATNGLRFEFIDEKERAAAKILRENKARKKRAVRCLETGDIFESAGEAAKYFNTSRKSINTVCRGKQLTTAGHRFEFVDSPLSEDVKNRQSNQGSPRMVRCIETNQIFRSITEAADFLKMSNANIIAVCNGRTKTAGGYHWRFVSED